MSTILIVDDQQERHDGFKSVLAAHDVTHAMDYRDAIDLLTSGKKYDLLLLDHDLWNERSVIVRDGERVEMTGHDVAFYIVNALPKAQWPTSVIVHSWNSSGSRNIYETLRQHGIAVYRYPYGTQLLEMLGVSKR